MPRGARHIGTGICPECEARVAINPEFKIGHHGWIKSKQGHKTSNACSGWYREPVLGSIFPIELNTDYREGHHESP